MLSLLVEQIPELALDNGAKIKRLNRWWIKHIIFRPRDKEGRIIERARKSAAKPLSEGSRFVERWKSVADLADWQIAKLWEADKARRAAKEAAKAKAPKPAKSGDKGKLKGRGRVRK